MIFNLKKIALIQKDDASNSNNDTVVTLTSINEGVDGSSLFGFSADTQELIIEGGNTYINSQLPELDVRVLKPTGNAYSGKTNLDQLKEWVSEQQELYVCALAIDGFVSFGYRKTGVGTVKIVANEQLSNSDIFAFKITNSSSFGYSLSTGIYGSGFFAGSNLASMYEWDDKTGSNVPDGWSSALSSPSFSNGVFLGTSPTSSERSFSTDIYLPFNSEQITFSLTIDSLDAINTYTVNKIKIDFRDASDSQVSTKETNISGVGRVSVTDYIPLNAVWVRVSYNSRGNSGNVTTGLSNPMIALGTKTTYTKF